MVRTVVLVAMVVALELGATHAYVQHRWPDGSRTAQILYWRLDHAAVWQGGPFAWWQQSVDRYLSKHEEIRRQAEERHAD